MEKKRFGYHLIVLIIIGAMLLVLASFFSVAWFTDSLKVTPYMTSYVRQSYFESGDGTGSTQWSGVGSQDGCAFEIKYPVQFYFFAWLQYMGYFNADSSGDSVDPDRTVETVYFYLSDDLDMTGWILPPIGTQDYPFLGNFNGNGHTVSNLTVQNVNRTAAQQAADAMGLKDVPIVGEVSGVEIVGVFGVVGSLPAATYSYSASSNKVVNLVIGDANITTETADSLAGIAAGYVNDSGRTGVMNNVTVVGTSTIRSTATGTVLSNDYLSKYALVGYTNYTETSVYVQNVELKTPTLTSAPGDGSSGAIIVDEGGGAGGQLLIDPNATGNVFTTVNAGASREVPGSADDTAFFVGYLRSVSTSSFHTKKFFKTTIVDDGRTVTINNDSNVEDINATNTAGSTIMDLADLGSPTYILPNSTPDYSNLTTITFTDNSTLGVPSNGVWFRPLVSGDCLIALTKTNNKQNESLSLYSYKRNANGAILESSKRVTTITVSSGLGNKCLVAAKITISPESVAEGREYVVGSSGSGTTAGFAYLILAGSNSQGGDGIAQGTAGSSYAVYERIDIATASLGTPFGVSFAGDPTAVYQINKQTTAHNNTYTFTSEEGIATTSTPAVSAAPGSAGGVIVPDLTESANTTVIRIITGYNDNNEIILVMKKTTTGDTSTFQTKVKPENGALPAEFTDVVALSDQIALDRYFTVSDVFSDDVALKYHHRIASESALIEPTTSSTLTVTDGIASVSDYDISSTTNQTVSIDVAEADGYDLTLSVGGNQVYP